MVSETGVRVVLVTPIPTERAYAEAQDAADDLAQCRERFVRDDPELIYLNGNSLGQLPVRTQARIADVVDQDWGVGLVRSWDRWIQLPRQAGDMVGDGLLQSGEPGIGEHSVVGAGVLGGLLTADQALRLHPPDGTANRAQRLLAAPSQFTEP